MDAGVTMQTAMMTPTQQQQQQLQSAAPLLANPAAPRAGTPMSHGESGTPTMGGGGCGADTYPVSMTAPFITGPTAAYYQIPAYANAQQAAYYQSPYGGVMLSQGTPPPAAMTPPPSSIMYMPVQYTPSGGMHFMATPPAHALYHDQPFEHEPAPTSLTPSPDNVGQTQIPDASPCDNPKAALCLEGSTVFKNRQNGAVPMWNYCQFCKNNGEPEEFFRSHILRNPGDGKVVCPVLRVYSCPVCNNGGGDYAHTKSYCPQLAKNNLNRFHGSQNRRHFGLNKAQIGGY